MGLVLGVWELCHQGRTVGVVLDVGEQLHQGRTCHQREMEHQCGDGVMHFVYLVAAFHQCIFEKIEQIIFHLFLELSFPLHGITHAEPLQPLLQQILALLWSWPFANPNNLEATAASAPPRARTIAHAPARDQGIRHMASRRTGSSSPSRPWRHIGQRGGDSQRGAHDDSDKAVMAFNLDVRRPVAIAPSRLPCS